MILLLALSALAHPPQLPNFGADALVSSVASDMQIATSGNIAGGHTHANLFWTPGSYPEICVEKKAGSTSRAYTFSIVYPDGAGLPDVTNPVWTGASLTTGVTGVELLCASFATGSQDDPSQFSSNELVIDAGEMFWLVLSSGGGAATSLSFGEVPQSGPVLVRRKAVGTSGVLAPVRAAIDTGAGFAPASGGAVLIYLVDAL